MGSVISGTSAAPRRRYVGLLVGALGLALALVLALNLALGDRGLGNAQSTRAASSWQQATKGVTYAPPVGGARPFKVLRLAERLPEINAVVLGSSTLMGITESMFPAEWRIYNFTTTGNSTAAIAGEARYIERHLSDRVHWMLAGLDWSVGMIYLPGAAADIDLSPRSVERAYNANTIPLHKQLEDALSWPRVANLGAITAAALKDARPWNSLKRAFFDVGGAEYRCSDGSLARDFDVINRGLCRGYRYDGSWTFANDKRLTPALAATYAAAAIAPSSRYAKHLCSTQGEPNRSLLEELGDTAQRLAGRGGRMIFLLPPLAPGMEKAFVQLPRWSACLARSKSALAAWARHNRVTVIDAGESERFDCVAGEFLDEHHAYPECHAKVLARYFRDNAAGRVPPGLYRPAS
jgi:hypothetical protein